MKLIKTCYDILISTNTTVTRLAGITETAEKSTGIIDKTVYGCLAARGLAVGTKDIIESFVCQDNVCGFISVVGVTADTLNLVCTWVPGTKYARCVFIPVSYGCKKLVAACKNGLVPWHSLCKQTLF